MQVISGPRDWPQPNILKGLEGGYHVEEGGPPLGKRVHWKEIVFEDMEEDDIEEVTYPVDEAGPDTEVKGGLQGGVTDHLVPGTTSDISKNI